MRNPGLVVAVLAFTLALATVPATATEDAAAAFVKAAIANLQVQQVPCKKAIEGSGDGSVFTCAKTNNDFEAFRDAWDRTLKIPAISATPLRPVSEWVTQVGGKMRWYEMADKWIVVTYDPAQRSVTLSYSKDQPGVLPLTRGMVPPRRIVREDMATEERRSARVGIRPEASGVVVLSAVIRKDGKVDNVAILGCLPRHQGLEQAALNAVRGWRYEPATRDGAAVNVAMTSAFTYGPGGLFRTTDGSDASSSGAGGGGAPVKGGGPG